MAWASRSLTREIAEPVPLAVRGELPAWLRGTLLRTGPSKFEVGEQSYDHWFDGLAMLHRFGFADGRVTYANRFLKSNAFRAAEKTGRIAFGEFATDPCRTLFGRVAALLPELTANCNVNVVNMGGETIAFTETTLPVRFDPKTLATLGVFGYAPPLRGQISTAHPHYDAVRKRHYSYMVEFGMQSRYRLYSVGDDAAQELVAKLPVDRPAYMHSFAMTERYLVLVEFPLTVSALALKFSGKPFIQNYPERGLCFHVIDKDSGREAATAKTDAVFGFHHVNALEDGDRLTIDMVAYQDATIIEALCLARLRAGTPLIATGALTRFEVPLAGDGAVTRRTLASAALELPRINYETRAGKALSLCLGHRHSGAGRLSRFDPEDRHRNRNGHTLVRGWSLSRRASVRAAPVRQHRRRGRAAVDRARHRRDRSFLLVLDAATLEERARAEAPHAIPFHFHGNYFASPSLPT